MLLIPLFSRNHAIVNRLLPCESRIPEGSEKVSFETGIMSGLGFGREESLLTGERGGNLQTAGLTVF